MAGDNQLAVEVTVTAAGPDKSEVVSTSSHIQVLPSTPGISLTLEDDVTGSFDTDGDGKSSVGDVVAFTLNVTNTGTVDLSRAKVDGNALDGLSCQQISPSAVGEFFCHVRLWMHLIGVCYMARVIRRREDAGLTNVTASSRCSLHFGVELK